MSATKVAKAKKLAKETFSDPTPLSPRERKLVHADDEETAQDRHKHMICQAHKTKTRIKAKIKIVGRNPPKLCLPAVLTFSRSFCFARGYRFLFMEIDFCVSMRGYSVQHIFGCFMEINRGVRMRVNRI